MFVFCTWLRAVVFACLSGSSQVRLSLLPCFRQLLSGMRFTLGIGLLFLAVPATVSACEGDCQTGVTNVFVGNYSNPVTAIMDNLVRFSVFLYVFRLWN